MFIDQLHRVSVDGCAEFNALGGAQRFTPGIRTWAALARLPFAFRRQKAPMPSATGRTHGSQEFSKLLFLTLIEGVTGRITLSPPTQSPGPAFFASDRTGDQRWLLASPQILQYRDAR